MKKFKSARTFLLPYAALLSLSAIGAQAPQNPPEPPWAWASYGVPETDNPCAIPTPYPQEDWRHKQYLAIKASDYSQWSRNVIFLGDSITHGWNWIPSLPDGNGAAVLKAFSSQYPKVRPLSLGMSSDEPQNTLWLVTEGDILEPFPSPKAIVLMIGINSLNRGRTPEEVAGGIRTITAHLREIRPESKILLLGILPCWGANAPVRARIAETNRLVASMADNTDLFFLDFGEKFLDGSGGMNPELSYDAIHLTSKGYQLWAETMFPYLDDLVQTGGGGELWKVKHP